MLGRHPKHCIRQIQLVESQLPAQRAELAAELRLFGLQKMTRAVCNPQKHPSVRVVGCFFFLVSSPNAAPSRVQERESSGSLGVADRLLF